MSFGKNGPPAERGSSPYLKMVDLPSRWKSNRLYDYYNPLDTKHFVMGDRIIDDLVSTEAFDRLRNISFLGGIDYVIIRHPNQSQRRYTRHEHSRGVARLAFLYSQEVDLSYKDRQLICVSALLHDIGHAPLSHSLEKTFSDHFGIEHHAATAEIITGRERIGVGVLELLRWYNIDVERVVAIIDGHEKIFDDFFSGPINFDTIEGILRTYSYVTKSNTRVDPDQVVRAAIMRASDADRDIVDEFWMYKDLVYNTIINSEHGVLADKICQKQMEDNLSAFSRDDYFTDEASLFSKLPRLKSLLTARNFIDLANEEIQRPVSFNDLRFFLDQSVEFFKP